MHYDQELIFQKLQTWEGYLQKHALPTWEELPTLELYMDQVISLLSEYLMFLPKEDGADTIVTAAAINNYVRKKIMPPPVKKRYRRSHLAYLVIICSLKQCVGISYIQRMLPPDLTEDEIRGIYDQFVARYRGTCLYFVRQINAESESLWKSGNDAKTCSRDLVISAALLSGLTRMLAEQLLLQTTAASEAEENP